MGTEKKVKKKIVRKKVITRTVKRVKEDKTEKEDVKAAVNEMPKSILAIESGDHYISSGDDTDSSSSDSNDAGRRVLVNRDMLGSFIKQKSDNFIEPELATSTGVMVQMQSALDSREQREILTTKQPSPFLAFTNTITHPQVKVSVSLPMDKQYPCWVDNHSPLRSQSGVSQNPVTALHLELKEFCSYMKLSKSDKKKLLSTGKQTLGLLQEEYSGLKGALVGSLATRLFHKNSTVDIAVWGVDVTSQDIVDTLSSKDEYTFVHEETGIVPIVTFSTSSNQLVKVILGEHASKTADFVAQMQGLYQDRLAVPGTTI
eukprot:TRINITY_DN13277_c0_g1_i2.p1 TRINITY_DN13277_c0_g1~~TRINITY_DN13277_c0_g1_i2.p1  ORF type:complete len:316 (+),score=51.71 TRINITY_DN13277_c0_g1_i2:79-1026(+)